MEKFNARQLSAMNANLMNSKYCMCDRMLSSKVTDAPWSNSSRFRLNRCQQNMNVFGEKEAHCDRDVLSSPLICFVVGPILAYYIRDHGGQLNNTFLDDGNHSEPVAEAIHCFILESECGVK